MITTEQIKGLRDTTGISVMQCKKVLEEASGDVEKALILLRKKGAEIASKKSDRTLAAGAIASYIHGTGMVGVLVELSCETDFVSKNSEFKSLAYDIAMHIAALNPEYVKIEDVSDTEMIKARELFHKEVAGKPEAIQAKILEGKLSAYFSDKVLLDQKFIKNDELSVRTLIQSAVQKFGEKIEVARFVRFSVGK